MKKYVSANALRASLFTALLVCAVTSIATAQTLPSPWAASDIGAPAMSGSSTSSSGVFTVTAGGPGTATEILNLYAYRKSFTELSIGYGSALAVALLIVTILISAVLFAMRRAK